MVSLLSLLHIIFSYFAFSFFSADFHFIFVFGCLVISPAFNHLISISFGILPNFYLPGIFVSLCFPSHFFVSFFRFAHSLDFCLPAFPLPRISDFVFLLLPLSLLFTRFFFFYKTFPPFLITPFIKLSSSSIIILFKGFPFSSSSFKASLLNSYPYFVSDIFFLSHACLTNLLSSVFHLLPHIILDFLSVSVLFLVFIYQSFFFLSVALLLLHLLKHFYSPSSSSSSSLLLTLSI